MVSSDRCNQWLPSGLVGGLLWFGLLLFSPSPAEAQAPLYLVNEETSVGEISFKFVDHQTFETSRLKNQIATAEPSFFTRVKDWFDWIPIFPPPARYPFDPVTLQKDVVRLERFYANQGFLQATVDYPASQLDTTSNTIHIIFAVKEGPPVIIQSTNFYGPDSTQYAIRQFDGPLREAWIRFRDLTSLEVGARYTQFKRLQIEDQVRQWLQNRGFAFANVYSEARIDSTANAADISFYVAPGPRGRFAEIDIEGNESVSRSVVMRELPFQVGDYFSYEALLDGQRQLFGLNLFRVALADVPEQPVDSTVRVRYRVREASLRYLTAQSGYGTSAGLTAEGQWTHRNFLGAARNLTLGLVAETGFLSNPGLLTGTAVSTIPDRRFRGSLSLRQPYFFATNLSSSIEPFIEYRRDPKLVASTRPLGLNVRDFGVNTTFIYEIIPFRTVSLQYTLTRSFQFTKQLPSTAPDDPITTPGPLTLEGDLYNKSVFSANATLGSVDDFLSPTRGFQVRPSAEVAGALLGSGVEYVRLSNELNGYLPLGDQIDLAGRLFVGRLWPFGQSQQALSSDDPGVYENRFDPIRFYMGGSNDLRGWQNQLAGDKFARPLVTYREVDGTVISDTTGFIFEPVGGNTKLAANIELRLPFPGLGPDWRTAVFLDAGQVREDSFVPTEMRFGTGLGIRYRTPVGFLRLDLAYKLNPGPLDLRDPRAVFFDRADPAFIERFRVHIGIGQSF